MQKYLVVIISSLFLSSCAIIDLPDGEQGIVFISKSKKKSKISVLDMGFESLKIVDDVPDIAIVPIPPFQIITDKLRPTQIKFEPERMGVVQKAE